MKKIILILLISSAVSADNDNIISFTVGVGPGYTPMSSTSSSSSSYATGHGHNAGNVTDNTTLSSSYYNQANEAVFGAQYMHKVSSSLYLGALAQTNKTYSLSLGLGF